MGFSLLSFLPLLLIALSIPPTFVLLLKYQPQRPSLVFLSSLLIGPFLLGLSLYTLLYLTPHQPNWFYILIPSLILGSAYYILGSKLSLLSNYLQLKLRQIKATRLSPFSRLMLIIIVVIFILIFVRMIFWPVNWDDQIFYIEQSYAFSVLKNLQPFFNWDFFRDHQLALQFNPAIRPALPMLYSFGFLASSALQSGQVAAQLIIFYFFLATTLITLAITYRLTSKNRVEAALLAVFLNISTYLFTSHIISGFKEFIIISAALLILAWAQETRAERIFSLKNLPLLLLLGFSPFIGLYGSLITILLLLIIFFINQSKPSLKILDALQTIGSTLLLSGLEFGYLFYWTIHEIIISKLPVATTVNTGITTATTTTSSATSELSSYGVVNRTDLYLKGKFQGFFQIEYYGLLFWIFLVILFVRLRHLIRQPLTKSILVFLLLYLLILIDPFNLNHHPYAYVLEISHKYTVALVPLLAVIIASQYSALQTALNRLRPFAWAGLAIIFSGAYYLVIRHNYQGIMKLLDKIIPVHQNPDYYLSLVKLASTTLNYLALAIVISIIGLYLIKRGNFNTWWEKYSISLSIFFVGLFFLPFLFFFNTNYGVKETLLDTSRPKAEKLLLVKGWQDLYQPLTTINKLPKNSRILFAGQSLGLIELHLNRPVDGLEDASDYFRIHHLNQNSSLRRIERSLKRHVDYIYALKGARVNGIDLASLPILKPVYIFKASIIYRIEK